jgi:hypothetical protein
VVSALIGLAGVAVEAGQPEAGARLLGAAEGLAAFLGAPMPMFVRDRPVHDRVLATLRPALGAERLDGARETGRLLDVEQAVAEASGVAEAFLSLA